MASNNGTNWLAVAFVFVGCVITAIAIGQLLDRTAWVAIGIGAGAVMIGVVHAISSRD